MVPPQTTQNPEIPSAELPESNLGIKKIREDIVALKLDAQAIETKRSDFEKNKKTLTKEQTDKIKQEIETEAKRIEAKKVELLTLIKQTKGELEVLKWSVETSVEKESLEALEKEIKEIHGENKNIFVKTRERGIENPKTAIAATAWVGLLVRGIVSLFRKKKSENGNSEWKKEKKKSKVRKWILGIGAWVAAIFGISWLIDKFKWETMKPGVEQTDDFDKLSSAEKEKYSNFGGKVNGMYSKIYQKEITDGVMNDANLGNVYNTTDTTKYPGVVPFAMDKTYNDIKGMLSEWAVNRHIRKKGVEEYKEILAGRGKDQLASLLWPTLMKIKSFSILGYKPGEDISGKIQTWLDNNPEEACKELDMFFRQFIMVLTYLEEKKIQLRRKLVLQKINEVGYGENKKKLTWLNAEDQDDLVEKALADDTRMKANVDGIIKSEFEAQKITTIQAILVKYQLYDETISEDLQKEIDDLDKERNDLLDYDESSKTDILDRAETDIADGTLEKGNQEKLVKCTGDVLNDAIDANGEGFMQTYFEPIAIACNMDAAAREKFLQESGGKELIENMSLGLTKYKEKFTAGTMTKEDIINFKIIVNKYLIFKKEAVIAVHTLQNLHSDNPDTIGNALNAVRAPVKGLYECFTEKMPRLKRTAHFCWWMVVFGGWLYMIGGVIFGKRLLRVAWKSMIKIGGIVPYLAFRWTMAGAKYAGRRMLFSGMYREGKVLDAKDPLSMFEYAFMNGEITPERGVKIARSLREKGKIATRIDTVEELLEYLKVPQDKIPLVTKYMNNKNVRNIIINKTTKTNFGGGDRWKYNVMERKSKWIYKFALDETDGAGNITKLSNLSKLKYIDAAIDESKKSGVVLKSVLQNIDSKQFDKLYIMANGTTFAADIDNLFAKTWTKFDTKSFGKLIGKNLDQFADITDMKTFFQTLETSDIDAESAAVIIREWKDVKVRLAKWEKLNDILTQLHKNFIKKVVPITTEVIEDLSGEQKIVAKLIGDDVDELKKFITGDLRKQPGWWPKEILGIHYEKQLEKLEQFQKEIKTFSPDELSAFKNLHALEFKSHHIIELLDLKKSNQSIASALENIEKKTGSIEDLLHVLKSEKKSARAGEEISESLIKTVERLHISNALKSVDEMAVFIKYIFKFISKI